jgi:hypothetical protein
MSKRISELAVCTCCNLPFVCTYYDPGFKRGVCEACVSRGKAEEFRQLARQWDGDADRKRVRQYEAVRRFRRRP